MEFTVGTKVGDYEILSPMGTGGMGEVYRAFDLSLDREVAVKVLPKVISSNTKRSQLRSAAREAAALIHPNIAVTYDLTELSGHKFLIEEYVQGETLAERLQDGALPIDESLRIALQIAKGLEAAHEMKIVHRDLRPENVMITSSGDVKLLDFGRGKFRKLTSPYLAILGSLSYMSPEQALGQKVDPATDVWALGCLIYEMLSGRRAFGGNTPADIVAGIVSRPPDWDALPNGVVPKTLSFLYQSLQKDPKMRIAFAGDTESFFPDFTETTEKSATYVNFWFPDLQTIDDRWAAGVAGRLIVNIGPKSDYQTAAVSDALSIDEEHLLYSLDHVDVMVLCPGAKVQPITRRIELPPGPKASAEFSITPKEPGAYEITVILIVNSDPIHRSFFKFEAITA